MSVSDAMCPEPDFECGVQALSDEHAEVKGSLKAEVVAKEVATRKLERITSNLGDSITVRHHCTLCVCLSVSLCLCLWLCFHRLQLTLSASGVSCQCSRSSGYQDVWLGCAGQVCTVGLAAFR